MNEIKGKSVWSDITQPTYIAYIIDIHERNSNNS